MNNQHKLLWKLMVLMCSVLLISACFLDDDDDDDGEGTTAEGNLALYVGTWEQECAPSDSTPRRQREITINADGTFTITGEDYDDTECTQSSGPDGQSSDSGTIKVHDDSFVSSKAIEGYNVDITIDGKGEALQIFSVPEEVDGSMQFYWGDEEGLNEDERPSTFLSSEGYAFVKQ